MSLSQGVYEETGPRMVAVPEPLWNKIQHAMLDIITAQRSEIASLRQELSGLAAAFHDEQVRHQRETTAHD